MVKQLATYLRGWLGYFGDCQTPSVLQTLESWLRRRLRSVVWKQWKRGRTRFRELRKRGVGKRPGGANRRESSRPVADCELARSHHRFAECLLGHARASTHGRPVLA